MIYACEHHDEVLGLWREQRLRSIRLAHVDFHDDLRGLLIDRSRRRAFPIRDLARGTAALDAGNFLAHAVLEDRVEAVRWIHDTPGGRAYDAGIVRYETDWFAWADRRRQRRRPAPEHALEFSELAIESWDGLGPGERLSVDWDCFASIQQDEAGIGERVARFLARLGDTIPADTYVAYSPEYSRPDLAPFRALVATLAERFDQQVAWLSPGLEHGQTHPRALEADPRRNWRMRGVLFLRRRGIF